MSEVLGVFNERKQHANVRAMAHSAHVGDAINLLTQLGIHVISFHFSGVTGVPEVQVEDCAQLAAFNGSRYRLSCGAPVKANVYEAPMAGVRVVWIARAIKGAAQ